MINGSLTSWVCEHPLAAYLWMPLAVSLALMGMYFSGVSFLQSIIVPDIQSVEFYSRREYGLLELLQNAVLLVIVACAWRSMRDTAGFSRLVLLAILALSSFVLLEEIDYGAHVADLFRSSSMLSTDGWDRNLHNQELGDGRQVADFLKLAANLATGMVFIVLPLLPLRRLRSPFRLLVPSRWIVATTVLMILLSRLAHWLDDSGFGVINGQTGYLSSNISEFRELNFYYLVLLYVAELSVKLKVKYRAASGIPLEVSCR